MSWIEQLKRLFVRAQAPGRAAAVVAAAGSSSRMGGVNKLLLEIDGTPVIVHTLRALSAAPSIEAVILVCRSEDMAEFGRLCRQYELEKVVKIVRGGANRTQSVLRGVEEAGRDFAILAVHDGARPLVLPEQVEAVVEKARQTTAAALAVPVTDSVQRVEGGVAVENIDRATIWAMQTPQAFDRDLLFAALTRAVEEGAPVTDECGAVQALGTGVSIVEGSYQNRKITTPEDIWVAESILAEREGTDAHWTGI